MDIKEQAFTKAIALLNASGAQYHIKFGDKQYGEKIGVAGHTRVRRKYPINQLRDYVMPVLERLKKSGDVEEIYSAQFDKESVRSSLSSYAQKRFGSGGYMTTIVDDKIQIMRIV